MSKLYNIAVVGATGAVGEAMLSILEERNFPVGEVYALASSKFSRQTDSLQGRIIKSRRFS